MPVRIILADDHQIVRQGIKILLEREGFKIAGEASDGLEVVQLAKDTQPDLAVIDIMMPVLNGLDAVRQIRRVSPDTKSILLTMHTEVDYVLEGLRAGANGFVLKTYAVDDLVRAIREVTRGRTYLSPEISHTLVQAYQGELNLSPDPLSPRERQVLQLVAEGHTTKQVANLLEITTKTAETYRSRIMEKLDIHETAGLVRYAIRKGLVKA